MCQFSEANSTVWCEEGRWYLYTKWYALQKGNPELRVPKSFPLGSKPTCPLLQREKLLLYSKSICYTNVLKKTVWNKSTQCLCSQKPEWLMESYLPTVEVSSLSNIHPSLLLAVLISRSDHYNSFLSGYHYSLFPGIRQTVVRMYLVNTNLIMSLFQCLMSPITLRINPTLLSKFHRPWMMCLWPYVWAFPLLPLRYIPLATLNVFHLLKCRGHKVVALGWIPTTNVSGLDHAIVSKAFGPFHIYKIWVLSSSLKTRASGNIWPASQPDNTWPELSTYCSP